MPSTKLLLTGSEGRIGRQLALLLQNEGYDVRGMDMVASSDRNKDHRAGDLRDLTAVRNAMLGVDAVIHLGAIPNDRDDGAAVMQTNVLGVWNVLQAALECGVRRFVSFSSINAQGSVKGIWPTEYLPIDDSYPHHPMTPYQLSKHLGEEICRAFSERHGMITLCLRPTWVTHLDHYAQAGFGTQALIERWKHDYWAYVDVRDVCDAALRCLRIETVLHDCFLLGANDTSAHVPTAQLLDRYFPHVPWPNCERDAYLAEDPFRSLIDCTRAKTILGWEPKHSWRHAI